jgi:hypothetical protein
VTDKPRPFKRLSVENHFNVITQQRVLVSWAMNEAFAEPGPYQFTLQRGRAVNDTAWENISQTVDQPWLYDNHPVFAQHDQSTFYRIILVDGNGVSYESQAVSAYMDWSHYDWRLAREIIRKETMLQKKRAGTAGWLLKRRQWGDPCPDCTDPNTGMTTNAHCETCFGTGVEGGYYPALEYAVTMDPSQRLRRLTNEQGLITAVMETVRALAWPAPEGNDVWVQKGSNKRYRIVDDITAIARHRGIDLVLNLHLEEVPQSSIVYQVPTP